MFFAGLALASLAVAVPFSIDAETFKKHGGNFLPGHTSETGLLRRAIGPGAAAVIGGVVSGAVAPAVTRWANKALGPAKRSEEALDLPNLTWDEARAAFVNGVTASVLEDGAEDGEAAICVSVAYTVEDPAKTRDAVSVSFTADGQEAVYDCFLLTDGAKFSIDEADYSEANIGIAGGELVDGVLAA